MINTCQKHLCALTCTYRLFAMHAISIYMTMHGFSTWIIVSGHYGEYVPKASMGPYMLLARHITIGLYIQVPWMIFDPFVGSKWALFPDLLKMLKKSHRWFWNGALEKVSHYKPGQVRCCRFGTAKRLRNFTSVSAINADSHSLTLSSILTTLWVILDKHLTKDQ